MTTYGLTEDGFTPKPLEEILAEIEAYEKGNISPALNVSAQSVVGQINAIMAAKLAELWELALAVWASQYPDSASGTSLDNVSAITGAQRLAATKSAVTVRCYGDDTTVLPVGRVLSVDPGGARFVSTVEATIGDVVSGYVDVPFEAEEAGPVIANAGTLTVIETPISGWDTADNLADAVVGRAEETDAELRARRIDLLALQGDATIEAIRANVLAVAGVTECFVFENDTDVVDADGLPPHSIEVVVRGGDANEIAQAIFEAKAAGILAYGTSATASVTDSQGVDHAISFTRPTDLVLEINVTVLTDPDVFPATGEQLIKDALADYARGFLIGDDVFRNRLFAPVFSVPGVLDVTTLEIRFNPPGGAFVTTSLAVSKRQLATLETTAVAVTVT